MGQNSMLASIRRKIRENYLAPEKILVEKLVAQARLSAGLRQRITERAIEFIRQLRENTNPTVMESFLAEYGLSTREGVALMCLAEALLRVPDDYTIDALIEDKISAGRWRRHQGNSSSSLVNASTWALMLTGKVLLPDEEKSVMAPVRGMIKRLGEPMVRRAIGQAMRELGRQFVLGRTIGEAVRRAAEMEKKGYRYSYDMLGEAARTEADARRYHLAYSDAITALSKGCKNSDIRQNPGISIKLSALHPRYEYAQKARVMSEIVARATSLALLAKSADMGFNIDAEEADRLDLSLDVIEAILSNPALAGWDGFGVVVQAFGRRASPVIDWLYKLAEKHDRKIMVRLVKGAYWDTEIKRAQTLGLADFPVFTRKINTDISYLACARKLLGMGDRIYPQFATHNAYSVSAVLEMAAPGADFEFQRLHGMGENLHQAVLQKTNGRCRIYAPVGAHQDLLAYLVRRLLENGANSSFVNQIVDTSISATEIARDPVAALADLAGEIANPSITPPEHLFGHRRINARGWDITDPVCVAHIEKQRTVFMKNHWQAGPVIAGLAEAGALRMIRNPANRKDHVGEIRDATVADVDRAIKAAGPAQRKWMATSPGHRAEKLRQIADLYERDAAEFFALCCREAGKTLPDAIGELREAVDFARYYAEESERLGETGKTDVACGLIACISPWNFPLAIFSGQILAALGAGNAVLAKPAEQTPLIAAKAVALMREAGIPEAVIQLLPGSGSLVGAALVSDRRINGVCFTGSTATAQNINRSMAENMSPSAPLIAETGGLNAMIVDSTALPEQAVRDILTSAFQTAGQRCSALRMLYIQEDIFERMLEMLFGAMDELKLGNPACLSTDIGPVIDQAAQAKINAYIDRHERQGRLLKRLPQPEIGIFVAPSIIKLDGIEQLEEEIFGPVLHVAHFKAGQIDKVLAAINRRGYGLTFGLHTRVDARVTHIVEKINVGNLYVNRNQIGAVVGSQPFGGEGLSGTGPKAGGPFYMPRFRREIVKNPPDFKAANPVTPAAVRKAIDGLDYTGWAHRPDRLEYLAPYLGTGALHRRLAALHQNNKELPGPTGELNQSSQTARGLVLCLGPDRESLRFQILQGLAAGNGVLAICEKALPEFAPLSDGEAPFSLLRGYLEPEILTSQEAIDLVACCAAEESLGKYRIALAARAGALVPLVTEKHAPERYFLERHLCIDTTAAGGNAALLATSA